MPSVGDDTVVRCGCDEIFESAAEWGNHSATECPIGGVDYELVPMSDKETDTEVSVESYTQIGSHEFAVNIVHHDDHVGQAVADLFAGTVEPIGPNPRDVVNDEVRQVLEALISDLPETTDAPFTFVKQTVNGGVGGGGSGGSSSGGSEDSFDGDIFTEKDGGDDLVENVEAWLSNYANVKSSMIEGAYSLKYGTITNPGNGESEDGVYIDVAPWYAGSDVWDSDDRSFASDDGKESFGDHRDAMRDIFSDDDSPVVGVVDDSGEYNEWYNYVPEDVAADL